MTGHPLALADQDRLELFAQLGQSRRLFRAAQVWTDAEGIAWTGTRVGATGVGLTWMGPNWVFDRQAQQERAEEYHTRRRAMRQADEARHRRELARAVGQLQLGGHAERLLWAVHAAVLAGGTALLSLSTLWLARAVWGAQRSNWPRHWHGDLFKLLKGFSFLHVAPWPDEQRPEFGPATVFLTHVGDLRGTEEDVCEDGCPDQHGPPHHHFQVEVGPAFLGVLEQFAQVDDASGVRTYDFPRGGPKAKGASLWAVGKTGRLVSVFLPAKVGAPAKCSTLTHGQHRLLQALVRETTRATRRRRRQVAEAEVFAGNQVVAFHGKKLRTCPLLNSTGRYVGFNGNGKLTGHGYLLASPGGWLAKAGYPLTEVGVFLDDLAALAGPLGLIAVGAGPDSRQIGLDHMRGLAATPSGCRALGRLHLRVYTGADFLERWAGYFNGDVPGAAHGPGLPVGAATAALLTELKKKGLSRRALAAGLKRDPSFLNKVLNGERPWPKGLLEKARVWVAGQQGPKAPAPPPSAKGAGQQGPKNPAPFPSVKVVGGQTLLRAALALVAWGWSVVPQLPGEKKPCVKWKPYQERLPDADDLAGWFEKWPDAGLALILGPVSGVLAVDVDGPEAHAALMARLGGEPQAPKALSGSGKPYRYHLFFRCPDVPTKAKQTPWHPNLEFRGKGGIVVIPPSLHKSGNRYAWAKGRSPDDLDLPDVPMQILEALKPGPPRKPLSMPSIRRKLSVTGVDASPRTLEFLSGKYSEGPRWNDRLFSAACDLCGRGMSQEEAEPLLLAGAAPWTSGEEELARRTIESAFAQPRDPARL
jgi:hypothetical protein